MGLLRLSANQGRASGDLKTHERLQALGEDLFQELIPVSLRESLEEAAGGDLHLYMDESLVHIPWELLHDGQGFFCRRFTMGRFVHTPGLSRRVIKRQLKVPLRFLSIADPEGNLPGAFHEGRTINDLILEMDEIAEPVLLTHHVSYGDFLDNLKRSDVLHFAGHVEKGTNGSRIQFSDAACTAEQIGRMAGCFAFPSLVFLNGCRSSVPEETHWSLEEGQARTFDFASRFLLAGSRHFIGTLWDVHDAVAAQAGTAFFRAFFKGFPVGAALVAAREQLIATFGELSMVWAGYVLYGNPGFRLEGLTCEADRLWEEIRESVERRKSCYESLRSPESLEKFASAIALYQMGDREGCKVIRKQFDIVLQFLKSPSLDHRHRGVMILQILSGSDWGFDVHRDPRTQSSVLSKIMEWWSSEETRSRFKAP
ncbi:MAG: CHAT domain-containing protein [Planctomycetota bacterium]